MHDENLEHFRGHLDIYWKVYFGLMVLTAATVGVTYIDFGEAMGVVVALLIAGMKAGLVAAIFMHLKGENKWVYYCLYLTAVFFLVLISLPLWTLLDTITDNV